MNPGGPAVDCHVDLGLRGKVRAEWPPCEIDERRWLAGGELVAVLFRHRLLEATIPNQQLERVIGLNRHLAEQFRNSKDPG